MNKYNAILLSSSLEGVLYKFNLLDKE